MKHFDSIIKTTFLGLMSLFLMLLTAEVITNLYTQFTQPVTTFQIAQTAPPKNFVLNSALLQPTNPVIATSPQEAGAVLGVDELTINFSTGDYGSSNGGVMVLNAKDTPEITVNAYNGGGKGTFKLYRATKTDLLNYLLYKRENVDSYGSSIQKLFTFDVTSVPVEKTFEQEILAPSGSESWYSKSTVVKLPLDGVGIWFLEGTVNGARAETMIVRSHVAAIIHKGNNQNIYWVQDTNYASAADVTIELFNTENSLTSLGELTTNQEGIAADNTNDALDVAVVSKDDDLTIIPINLSNLNYRTATSGLMYSSFSQRQPGNKAFMFTDRFLYKPGDTVYFKAVIRTDDDVDYAIKPRTMEVTFGGYDKPFWQQTLAVSELGTIDGSIPIPADAQADYYTVTIKEGDTYIASADLQVAHFRKPDASVNVSTDKLMYLPGEKVTITVEGTAFLGQPLRDQDIRYKIYQIKAEVRGDYSQLSYGQEGGYVGDNLPITEGTVTLDRKGTASFQLTAKNTTGFRQFWVIKIEYLDGASTAANDTVQTLIQPGDFVIEDDNANDGFVVNKEMSFPIKLSKNELEADISNITVTAKLYVYGNNGNFVLEKDGLSAVSDALGKLSYVITPARTVTHKLELETHDKDGNLIKGEETFYVSEKDRVSAQNIFTITSDKKEYNIGDTAKITIATLPEIKNIFVSLGRSYAREYRVLPVNNGTTSFEFSVVEKYQPNLYVYAGSFLKDEWKQQSTNLDINTTDKEVTVKITPSQNTYGPGESANFEIQATDGQGRPVATDVAFWIFDKALLELHGNYFAGIFETFWSERWFSIPTNYSYEGIISSGAEGGGGCFAGETLITMADGSKKRIDQVTVGDTIVTFASATTKELQPAKVLGTHAVTVDGYLIINGVLKITPEHILLVNNQWQTAGEIKIGDTLLSEQGAEETVTSIEWVRGKFPVYNLQIEKFQTFLADHIYVHNEKADIRSTFKDTAYWNPHLTTDENGKASVTVKLPDNLTTWVAAAVAANNKTQVGDGKTEFLVTKDIVVRPIFPAFLRTGDEITLSALLYNFTQQKESFGVTAKFEGGDLSDAAQSVVVDAKDFVELFWPVKVIGSNQDAIFTVATEGSKNNTLTDTVIEKLPIYEYGSWISNYSVGRDTSTLPITLAPEADAARAEAVLTLTASRYPQLQLLLNTLVNRANEFDPMNNSAALIAASILKTDGKALGIVYNQDTVDQKVQMALTGLKASRKLQAIWLNNETNQVDAGKTRFVIEALVTAQQAGFLVEQALIDNALTYMSDWQPTTWTDTVEQQYIFSLFPNRQLDRARLDVTNQHDAGVLARAALANHRQGFITSDQEENAISMLAHTSEYQVGWKVPRIKSRDEWFAISLPTAWATYALQELTTDVLDLEKALDYLYRNAEYDAEQQAVQALATVKYYQDTKQITPNYQYKVLAGETVIAEGLVTSAQQVMLPISLSPDVLQGGNDLTVEKSGLGQLFSQLEIKQFYTSPELSPHAQNLTLTRKYLSTKAAGQPTNVGDLVMVQFQVGGLGLGETEIELEDYLPSGLIAIDETLNNGNFDSTIPTTSYTDQEITEQGMRLKFSAVTLDGTYSYKTRVVSQGVFDAPPAVVKLVNEPTIWASTSPDRLKIDGKSALETIHAGFGITDAFNQTLMQRIAGVVLAAGILAVVFAYLYRAKIRLCIEKIRHGKPPQPPQPLVPPQI